MPQYSMLPQISIPWKDLKETPWVSKDALLASRGDQIKWSSKESLEKWSDRVTNAISIQQSAEESRIARQSQPERPTPSKAHLDENQRDSDQ